MNANGRSPQKNGADAPRGCRSERQPWAAIAGETEPLLLKIGPLQHHDADESSDKAEPADRPEPIAAGKDHAEKGDPQRRRRRQHGRFAALHRLQGKSDQPIAAQEQQHAPRHNADGILDGEMQGLAAQALIDEQNKPCRADARAAEEQRRQLLVENSDLDDEIGGAPDDVKDRERENELPSGRRTRRRRRARRVDHVGSRANDATS